MTIDMPVTTKTFGQQSLLVLTAKPAAEAAITVTEAAAGENVSLHVVGSLFPTATTEKTASQRKMGQTKTRQQLGATTWDIAALQYTCNPQKLLQSGAPGNEAYEALPEGTIRYLALFTGVPGDMARVEDDVYQLIGVRLGPQVIGATADDAGGEASVTQEVEILAEYTDGPVLGKITDPS